LNDALVQHLKEHYGLVVIHPKMDPITAQAYRVAFEPLLGKPTEEEGCLVWRLSKP
jgi:hypothetical protein